MSNEELVEKIQDFEKSVISVHENMLARYLISGSTYSEGALDTIISMGTLYREVFSEVLEEKES